MKLQPASRRELKRISVGVGIGSAAMVAVFAVLWACGLDIPGSTLFGGEAAKHPPFWTVPLGAVLGAAGAVANFYYLCISVQRAAAADEMMARLIMRSSYSRRMFLTIAVMAVGFIAPCFHWLATIIPFLMPRLTILVRQLTGQYKPDEPEPESSEPKEEG